MRWSVLVVLALASGTAVARPSNPAFLGISMGDIGGVPPGGTVPRGPCQIGTVTRGSGAMEAGLQGGDILLAVGATKVPNCDAVLKSVQDHDANDTVTIAVLRDGQPLSLSAQLLSRDEILRRRLVGQPIAATDFMSVDDPSSSLDLSGQRGKTTIVAWYASGACAGCATVLGHLATWARKHGAKTGAKMNPVAVTSGERDPKLYRGNSLEVPLFLADPNTFEELAIPEHDRITFMVIDCRGIVQHIAPVLPDAEDADAMLDGIFAAAEQAAHHPTK